MRFITRMLAGVGTAALLTAGIAATAAPASAATASAPAKAKTASWGPFRSADGTARAAGAYTVNFGKTKVGYWKTSYTWHRKCSEHKGKKVCRPYKKPHKRWAWKWVTVKNYTVHSSLWNAKWTPKRWKHRCAWETFKVRHDNGKVSFHTFRNCDKTAKHVTFHAKNVDAIWVNVARGDHVRPLAQHSGWRKIA